MKVAVTGKGGVGKTTISCLLATALARRGRNVVAIDADPDSNLAACMGHPHPEELRPLVELNDLIEERTGVKPGTTGGMFRLNPFVEDLPDKYAVLINGVRLLVAGAVKKGGAGCYCPENALVRALISHLLIADDSALVLDMEAGIEHLTRGTVRAVDALLVVVEPTRRSIETAQRVMALATEIGLNRVYVVVNKVRSTEDEAFARNFFDPMLVLGYIPYSEVIRNAEMNGKSVGSADGSAAEIIENIIALLERRFAE